MVETFLKIALFRQDSLYSRRPWFAKIRVIRGGLFREGSRYSRRPWFAKIRVIRGGPILQKFALFADALKFDTAIALHYSVPGRLHSAIHCGHVEPRGF